MEIRKLNAARGWIWVKHGYMLILRNPLLSISLALVAAMVLLVVFKLPLFGPLLALLLMPVVMAGYARICRALEEDEKVELTHLFNGFKQHTARLVALGGFLLMGLLLSSMAMILIGGEALSKLMEDFQTANDPQMLVNAMSVAGSGVALSLMLGFALMCILMLAFQYAPMLVFFNDMQPFAALRASLSGSWRNIIPYVVYSLIMQVVAVVLSILPFNIGLIVLLPLGITSLYVSYRNIFPFADEIAASQHVPPGTVA